VCSETEQREYNKKSGSFKIYCSEHAARLRQQLTFQKYIRGELKLVLLHARPHISPDKAFSYSEKPLAINWSEARDGPPASPLHHELFSTSLEKTKTPLLREQKHPPFSSILSQHRNSRLIKLIGTKTMNLVHKKEMAFLSSVCSKYLQNCEKNQILNSELFNFCGRFIVQNNL